MNTPLANFDFSSYPIVRVTAVKVCPDSVEEMDEALKIFDTVIKDKALKGPKAEVLIDMSVVNGIYPRSMFYAGAMVKRILARVEDIKNNVSYIKVKIPSAP